jgi:tryptophan synthase beta chain
MSGAPARCGFAERLTEHLGGAKIYLKREDLNHTGAHKINNCIGQILLAKRMGKTRIIAETGAGQHGVATATVAALFGLPCTIFMGAVDVARQQPNVFRMKLLGAEVVAVESGAKTLKDAMNEALRHWVANVHDTFYIIGTVAGPHPYPELVRDFQSVIGDEAREQILEAEGRLPDMLIAPVGGGSNAIGLFHPFLDDTDVEIVGVEAAGEGLDGEACREPRGRTARHPPRQQDLSAAGRGRADHRGAFSISAGLDYPGIGPEHSLAPRNRQSPLRTRHRRRGAGELPEALTKLEGIIPALESAHAIAAAERIAPTLGKDKIMIVNCSGRGDKDIFTVADALGVAL